MLPSMHASTHRGFALSQEQTAPSCVQVVAPDSCRHCYSERLALMPNCYFVNDYKQAHLVRPASACVPAQCCSSVPCCELAVQLMQAWPVMGTSLQQLGSAQHSGKACKLAAHLACTNPCLPLLPLLAS